MKIQDINNFFGDIDLFLMDLILKGHIKEGAKVLDIGCGEGRNGIYFIQRGYDYHGWDTDPTKLKLLEYLAKTIKKSKTTFVSQDFTKASSTDLFDFIICSRVLHFALSKEDFLNKWMKIASLLTRGGILYASLDSVIDTEIGIKKIDGFVEFPDGKHRYALDKSIYQEIIKGFEEIEPLRTLVHHNERAQSFLCLKKL